VNCANHPEIPAAAYCQFCGKPLCEQCVHRVGGIVACEPCLASRIGVPSGAAGPQFTQAPGYQHFDDGQGNSFTQGPGYQNFSATAAPGWAQHPWGTEPWVAFALGWIPGVGAMYNGQFVKGLVHVVIFALLVNMAHYNGALGLVVAAWVFYQVFDAYQTARARRQGLPVPNPLGLNDIGSWFAARTQPPAAPGAQPTAPPPAPGTAPWPPAAPFAAPGATIPPGAAIPPVPPDQYDMPAVQVGGRHAIPTGAIALILIGVGFLLANMGILSENWIDRGWPILLIALGVWLVIQRSQTPPQAGGRP
jgi:hypothetical protein